MEPPSAPTSIAPNRDWWWVFDPRLSLRAAAALTVGGGAIVLIAFIMAVASVTLQRSLEAQVGTTLETLAFQLTDKIDRTLYDRYRTLQFGAGLPAIRGLNDASPAERRRAIEAIRENSPDFVWIGLLDATGRVVAATRGQSEGMAMGDRPWFLQARERAYLSNPREVPASARDAADEDTEGASRLFDLAMPIAGPNGQFGGVLAAQVRWSWALDVQSSVVSDTARRERIGATLYGPNKDVLLDSGVSGWTQPPDPPAIAEGRRWRGYFIESTPMGSDYVTGFARSRGFREYRGLGWIAAVRQPVARAFAPVETLKRTLMRWGAVLVIALVVASWIVAGRYARRLRTIGAAAQRIREGDILTVLPRPAGDSEIARMCAALGDMVDDFREKQTATEAQNARLRSAARPKVDV